MRESTNAGDARNEAHRGLARSLIRAAGWAPPSDTADVSGKLKPAEVAHLSAAHADLWRDACRLAAEGIQPDHRALAAIPRDVDPGHLIHAAIVDLMGSDGVPMPVADAARAVMRIAHPVAVAVAHAGVADAYYRGEDEEGLAAAERACNSAVEDLNRRRAELEGISADPVGGFTDGAAFILDQPDGVESIWGDGDASLWAAGEATLICGPQGVGKSTLAGNVVAALLGLGDAKVLGLPVRPVERVLYLAMDRPRQLSRALRRQLGGAPRAALSDRLVVWEGPPPADLARDTGMLLSLAERADADVVVVDSLKDAALGLSEDEVGAAWNRARQGLLRSGRNILELHHITKRFEGASPSIRDVYGSTWITSGAGSVILLNGDPGDPVVQLHHLKQPVEEIGPLKILHDGPSGRVEVAEEVDLLAVARGGITALHAAAMIFGVETPTHAQREKARRRLEKLVATGWLVTRPAGPNERGALAYWPAAREREPGAPP